jgi:hypothetical protein
VAFLEVFHWTLTRPSYFHLLIIAAGWVLTQGSHAVTEALVVTGVSGAYHYEAFHRFFSRATWDPDDLGHWLFLRLRPLAGRIRIVVDDTLATKKGSEVFGLGTHLDPVRSSKKHKTFAFGHVWVTLCVLVQFPFSSRAWALPLLFRLYRAKKECEKHPGEYRTKNQLAKEMLRIFHGWCRADERIELMADNAFCCDTVTRGLPQNIVLIGAMRLNAVLTAAAPAPVKGRRGRPRKRGVVLPKPSQLADDESTPWQRCKAHIYGKTRVVTYKTCLAQWYQACGTRLLRVVVVKCETGNIPFRVFFATDTTLTVSQLLELYSWRWCIEVTFRNLKQLFGFADSSARSKKAVLRTAPFVGLLYTAMVLWYAEHAHGTDVARFPLRPWYPWKKDVCFADVLRAGQATLRGVDIPDLLRNDADLAEFLPPRVRAAPEPSQMAI